ncbi:MAG: Putative membrane transport protein, partial [uncultured Nocardioidaceae bacterium]
VHRPPAPGAPSVPPRGPSRDPVPPLRPRRRHVHDRLGGLLHPDRRALRGAGRPRPDDRRRRGVPGSPADGQAGRPLRCEEDVGGERRGAGVDVRGVAVHHRLQGLRRDGGRHGGHRRARRRSARRLHDRCAAARGAGDLARLHVLRPQRRLHSRRPPRRDRARLRVERRPARPAVVHRGGLPGQRQRDHPAAEGVARRAHRRGAQGQDPRTGAAAEPWLAAHHVLRWGLLDQPGAAQHRDPVVAGGGDRRPEGAAGVPLRHQHGDVHLPADGRGARGQGRVDGPEGDPALLVVLRGLLPHHAGHPRHGRLGHDRAGLAGARHGDRRRAVPVGRQLVVRGRADGPAAAWRVPGSGGAEQHVGARMGTGALHVPRHRVGCRGLARDRRDHRGGHRRRAPLDPARPALPRRAHPGRRAGRRSLVGPRGRGGCGDGAAVADQHRGAGDQPTRGSSV